LFYSFGYGEDHDDDLLNKLANIGNGRFMFIKNNKILDDCVLSCFGDILSIIAKDIYIEIFTKDNVEICNKLGTKWIDNQKTKKEVNKVYFQCISTESEKRVVF